MGVQRFEHAGNRALIKRLIGNDRVRAFAIRDAEHVDQFLQIARKLFRGVVLRRRGEKEKKCEKWHGVSGCNALPFATRGAPSRVRSGDRSTPGMRDRSLPTFSDTY